MPMPLLHSTNATKQLADRARRLNHALAELLRCSLVCMDQPHLVHDRAQDLAKRHKCYVKRWRREHGKLLKPLGDGDRDLATDAARELKRLRE